MSRVETYSLLLLGYLALYGRSVLWGFTGMDDTLLLEQNPYLGHDLAAFTWGLTDTDFGRRWLPGTWTLANLFSGGGAFGFRLGTLLLGAGLVGSVLRLLEERVSHQVGIWGAVLFMVSPMRWEIFGWGIGFIYTATAILCVWAIIFHLQDRKLPALVSVLSALFVYPQAAGVALLLIWLWRKTWWGYGLFVAVLVLGLVQMKLRTEVGYVPMQYNWGAAFCALPHYILMQIAPLSTVPIVPNGFHWGVCVGAVLFALALATRWQSAMVCACVFAPVVLAAVTESFWYGARYSTLLAIAVVWFASPWLGRQGRGFATAMACGFLSVSITHVGFRSLSDSFDRARHESTALYGSDAALQSSAAVRGRIHAAAAAFPPAGNSAPRP